MDMGWDHGSIGLPFCIDGQAIYKRTYAVSNDRTIMVSPLEPGKTYITILVAGDGIRAESRSDPQSVTTLGKGTYSLYLTVKCSMPML